MKKILAGIGYVVAGVGGCVAMVAQNSNMELPLWAAIIAILIGAIMWGIFGRINTSVNVAVVSSSEGQTCYVPYDELEGVMSAGMVTVDENDYALQMDADTETVIISEATNPYIRVAGGLHIGDVAVLIPVEKGLPQGIYTGAVTTESLQPITLLIQ